LIRELIPEFIAQYRIKTIADVGCGDQNWIKKTDLRGAEYTGYDYEVLTGHLYRQVPIQFDAVTEVLPRAYDMVMCIYVLNHLYGEGDIKKAVHNFQKSGSKWLLATFNDVDDFPLVPAEKIFHKEKESGMVKRNWYYGWFPLGAGSYDSS
jgi:2-polyprenyl-3-methyl-5-hydroxy-6-metoxy-1,4-benzoquinol methylase